jgi:hypothetical protein
MIDNDPPPPPWHPIETAQKDTPLLLWFPTLQIAAIGFWPSERGASRRWRVFMEDGSYISRALPSHWMALPEPPEGQVLLPGR